MNRDRNLARKFLIFLENKAYFPIVIGALIILFATLLPFNFATPRDLSWIYIINRFSQKTNPTDIVVNVILFLPFGWGLAALLSKTRKPIIVRIIVPVAIGFFLSLTVETAQIFLVSREPSIADLITNSFGLIRLE